MCPPGGVFLLLLMLGSCPHSSSRKEKQQVVCGQRQASPRIVRSVNSMEGNWPWQVSVRISSTHVCGGSLIGEKWILTAAHCLKMTLDPFVYTVWMGSNNIERGTKFQVDKIIIHPFYHETTADIALLKLYSNIELTSLIMPICLPNITEKLTIPPTCWVTGWGTIIRDKDHHPSILQETEVPTIDREKCEKQYNPLDFQTVILEDMFCAGGLHEDSCKADSGGPLSCFINGQWVQIGLVSRVNLCGLEMPGVYTNVSYYLKWIYRITSRAESWMPTIWIYVISCSLLNWSLWLY